ncbi:MAG: hypothetical protein ABI401_01845 [Candidatus Dormibacter sp.]
MGNQGSQRSVRRALTYLSIAAAAASSILVLGTSLALATAAPPEITVGAGSSFSIEEGSQATGKVVATFTDDQPQITRPSTASVAALSCDAIAQARYDTTIDWGDNSGTSSGTVSCGDGHFGVAGSHTYSDSGTYHINVTVTDSADSQTASGTDTATATVTDADLSYDDYQQGPARGTSEGTSVTLGAAFFDSNSTFPEIEGLSKDPGINGTINWGDGSAVQTVAAADPPAGCECFGDIWIGGSHVYDANVSDSAYTVTFTANDDGGSTGNHTMTVTILDGALTAGSPAKSFTATSAQATTPVVASFTDAAGAQAKVADFAATINWGDNATSSGTVTETAAGAFDVSGTHTYASAGNRTLSITVTDEEGQTVTMAATATVGAAPVVLPQTGQAKEPPATTAMPGLLIAIALGLLTLVGGVGGMLVRRRARI